MPHIECVKNNGKPYLRLAESRYVKDIGKQKKFIIKNIGPLSKYDDGKPDFLKRFREKFKNGEIDFVAMRFKEKIYIQVAYILSDDNVIEREFGAFKNIDDNYPKYVLTLDKFDFSQNGIIHKNVIDWLLEEK